MATITTKPTDFLHHRYPRELRPQPCYVALDCETGTLRAETDGEIGGAVPVRVWHKRVLRWKIPALKASVADELLAELVPLAERVVAGYSCEWDGHNNIGRYSDDAMSARDEIDDLRHKYDSDDTAALVVWEAADWYDAMGAAEVVRELGITADTTDEQIEALAESELAKARADDVDDVEGLERYLTRLRDELRAE